MKLNKKSGIFRLEHEVVTQCDISKERFRKVSGSQWENIYQKIAEKYADKTKIWKNGLHCAKIPPLVFFQRRLSLSAVCFPR